MDRAALEFITTSVGVSNFMNDKFQRTPCRPKPPGPGWVLTDTCANAQDVFFTWCRMYPTEEEEKADG
jgi:hypothetical protein